MADNTQMEGIWKELPVANVSYYHGISRECLGKTMKIPIRDMRCVDRDPNCPSPARNSFLGLCDLRMHILTQGVKTHG